MINRNRLAGLALLTLLTGILVMPSFEESPETPWTASEFARGFPVRSEYLKSVAEPIAFVHGGSYSDGGSRFLEFKDSNGQFFYACLKDDLEGDRRLTFVSPTPSMGIPVPVIGIEEREFLGMLERWASADQDSQYWIRKFREARKRRVAVKSDVPEMTEELYAKGIATSIMNDLLKRNGKPRLW